MDNNIKGGQPRWEGGGDPDPSSQRQNPFRKGTPPKPDTPSRSGDLSGLSNYEAPNARRGADAEGPRFSIAPAFGTPARRALPPSPRDTLPMLEARRRPLDRFADEQIKQLQAELNGAGEDIARTIGKGSRSNAHEVRTELPIVGARQLPFKPFVHATPDRYAMIAQKDPAYFARATLDEQGTLHVEDMTRSYDDTGRQLRVAGLNTPDFIDKALRHFGEPRIREIAWRWDAKGDSLVQFGEGVSRQASLRQAVENTRTGQRLLQAGFRVTHTEIAGSHADDSGLVYDAIDVRWEKAETVPAGRNQHEQREPHDAQQQVVRAVDIDFDLIARLPPEQRAAALEQAAKRFVRDNVQGPAARIEIDACTPEVAQCIADSAYVPVTVNGTLLKGQPAVYMPRMRLRIDATTTFEQTAWIARAWLMRYSSPANGIVIDRTSTHPDARQWMQALADRSGAPVSWPREMAFWGDEENVTPRVVHGRALDDIADAERFGDSTMLVVVRLPRESELPIVKGEGGGASSELGTVSSIDTLRIVNETYLGTFARLKQAGNTKRIETIAIYDPDGTHSRELAQAIADQYGAAVDVTVGPAAGGNRVFVAGRDGITADSRYEPRMRCREVDGSVRAFADRLRARADVSSAGLVIHPDALPPAWLDAQEASLQTLSDLLDRPVVLARFEGGGSSEFDLHDPLAEPNRAMAPEQALYRDEMRFIPESRRVDEAPPTSESSAGRSGKNVSTRGRAEGTRLSSREILESASRDISSIVEDIDTQVSRTRSAASHVLPRVFDARRKLSRAKNNEADARRQWLDWQVAVTLEEWKARFPEDMFGPVDDELKGRIEQWVVSSGSGDRGSSFDETVLVVHGAAVFERANNTEARQRIEGALKEAQTASLAAQAALEAARPDRIGVYENRLVGYRAARQQVDQARQAVGLALNAARSAQGRETSAPEMQGLADELAQRADHALTELFQALEAIPEMPAEDRES